jgi:hypothetical protein
LWLHFWSVALYDLHLTTDEFYDLTPRQFGALHKRHLYKVEHDEFMFAQLNSWIANTGFRNAEKPTTPYDFMPSQWLKKSKSSPSQTKPIRMTKKRRQAICMGLRATLGQISRTT